MAIKNKLIEIYYNVNCDGLAKIYSNIFTFNTNADLLFIIALRNSLKMCETKQPNLNCLESIYSFSFYFPMQI